MYMAPRAMTAIEQADVIVGYKTYMDMIEPVRLKGKETVTTGMKGEIRRCKLAIEKALEGFNTAVVSGGDAGIYGMAGLVIELLAEQDLLNDIHLEVVPGIPALAAGAALLGAPLMHDFAVISLSDLMTPWEQIKERIKSAAGSDFVLVIYNPRSIKRDWQLGEARDLIMKCRDPDTPVGIVKNAAREEESAHITTLSALNESQVDMLSILIIGNSGTKVIENKMVTPRGYIEKYGERSQ